MSYRKFYTELGKLLYAVADADGVIRPQEVAALRNVVRKRFIPLHAGADSYGQDHAYYSEFEFEALQEHNADPELAFSSFISYAKGHPKEFTGEMKKLCLLAAEEVGEAFSGKNIYEEEMIRRLKEELEA